MENKKILLVIAGLLVLGGFGYLLITNNNSQFQSGQTGQGDNVQKSETIGNQDAQVDNVEFTERYISYSEENLTKATENDNRAVLFFHAGWCPSCQAAERDFTNNFSEVPNDVTILKADYDTETELKKKYGIVTQDTFVQIDSQGNEISKWNSGGRGIRALLANLK